MDKDHPLHVIIMIFLAIVLLAVFGVALFSDGQKPAAANANTSAVTTKAEPDQSPIVVITMRASNEATSTTVEATEEINNLPEPPSLEVLKKARVVHPQSPNGSGMVEIKGRLY